jgi:hypothetical protein
MAEQREEGVPHHQHVGGSALEFSPHAVLELAHVNVPLDGLDGRDLTRGRRAGGLSIVALTTTAAAPLLTANAHAHWLHPTGAVRKRDREGSGRWRDLRSKT